MLVSLIASNVDKDTKEDEQVSTIEYIYGQVAIMFISATVSDN